MHTIKDALEGGQGFSNEERVLDKITQGEEVRFVAQENHKKPGSPIFVQDDGKVGFPSFNGLQVSIGDKIRGIVYHKEANYFFVEVVEILERAPKPKKS